MVIVHEPSEPRTIKVIEYRDRPADPPPAPTDAEDAGSAAEAAPNEEDAGSPPASEADDAGTADVAGPAEDAGSGE